jgi:hypothetical protein
MHTRSRVLRSTCLIISFAALFPAVAAAQLRVANWNVSSYSGGRIAEFQTAIYATFEGRSMAPDLLIGQEFVSQAGVDQFRGLLNSAPGSPGDWQAAPFINGPDTDSAFLYRTSKVDFLGYTIVAPGGSSPNHPRNLMRYDVRLKNYAADAAVLACFSSHMKSGTSGDDEARRLLEAQHIRANAETLNPQWSFLLGGDFNMHSSIEDAYEELVGSQPDNRGRFFDPIDSPGGWYQNYYLRFTHTQDPIGAGGMDDRFDQILVCAALIDGQGSDYLGAATIPYSQSTWDDSNHSYRAWGNDGTSFDTFLTIEGNEMVGATVAQALVDAALSAGHLPVFLDLLVPPKVGSDVAIDFGRVPLGSPAIQPLAVWNDGDIALWTSGGINDLYYSLLASVGFSAPSEPFVAAAGAAHSMHDIAMDTSAPGHKEGTLTILSDAPDEPLRVVSLTGEVVVLLPGDLNCDGAVDNFDISPFVLALTATPPDYPEYYALYSSCDRNLADINGDGSVDNFDISPFVALLTGG